MADAIAFGGVGYACDASDSAGHAVPLAKRSAFAEGLHGVAANAEGPHGVTANAEGSRGVTANAEGLHGVAANAEGLHGVAANAEGSRGVTANAEGLHGVAAKPVRHVAAGVADAQPTPAVRGVTASSRSCMAAAQKALQVDCPTTPVSWPAHGSGFARPRTGSGRAKNGLQYCMGQNHGCLPDRWPWAPSPGVTLDGSAARLKRLLRREA